MQIKITYVVENLVWMSFYPLALEILPNSVLSVTFTIVHEISPDDFFDSLELTDLSAKPLEYGC